MKKELLARVEAYTKSTEFPKKVYFSDRIPDARYSGKFFFKYCNTHTVAAEFKTQREIEKYLAERGF